MLSPLLNHDNFFGKSSIYQLWLFFHLNSIIIINNENTFEQKQLFQSVGKPTLFENC